MTSFNLIYPFKGPISKYSHILGYWELGFQHVNFWRIQISQQPGVSEEALEAKVGSWGQLSTASPGTEGLGALGSLGQALCSICLRFLNAQHYS